MNGSPFDINKVISTAQAKEIEQLRDRLFIHFRRQQINEQLVHKFRTQLGKLPENHPVRVDVEKMLQMFADVIDGKLDKPRPRRK